MYNAKIDQLIDSWRDEILEDLKNWIKIPSVNAPAEGEGRPFGKAVRDILDLAMADARKMGFEAQEFDGYAGHVVMGSGAQTMGILAHLDVVPVGDGWTKDPFGGEISEGRIYGRGTSDDKGPALAALYAMRAVKEAGIPLKDGVRLILGCDEETGMEDMRHYAAINSMPDYGFSPDADYPLINIEKGGLGLLLSCDTGDESDARVPVYEMYAGERSNVVPGTAWAEIGGKNLCADKTRELLDALEQKITVTALPDERIRLETEGVSSHASMPHLGINAAGILLKALKMVGAGGPKGSKAIDALADKLGLEGDGKSLGIAIRDQESGPLTCNLGLLRYDGHALTAQLDIRYPIAADETTMCGQAVMALSGTPLSVSRLGGHGVHHIPADHKVVRGLLEVYHDVTGLPAYPIAIGGGTYSRTMPNTVAFGCNFPGDTDMCHMPDEYMEIEKYMLSIKIMAHAIEKLAGGM